MQDADEQDTCRICSAPGEPDQPLFYPCKCSGTIRYIHQDCKKKTCDVCKYPYAFTKVYDANMPARLPPFLLVRRLIQHSLWVILFAIRAVIVGIVWLALLPWVTVWTWRMYFTMGDSTAWWIADRPRPIISLSLNAPYLQYHNITNLESNSTYTLANNVTLAERAMSRPFWRAVSADIFAGQIIASLIVLTFVAVFLLREWISQNARPGVFEDEEGFAEQGDGPPPLEPIAGQQVAPVAAFVPPPMPVPAQLPIATGSRSTPDRAEPQARDNKPRRVGLASRRGERRRRLNAAGEKGKGKARDVEYSGGDSDADRPAADRARARRRLDSGSETSSEESDEEVVQKTPSENRDVRAAAAAAALKRVGQSDPPAPMETEKSKFEFTFKVPTSTSHPGKLSERRTTSSSPSVWSSEANPSPGTADAPSLWATHRDSSADPTDSPSSSSSTASSAASPQAGVHSLNPSFAERLFVAKPTGPPSPIRRPPMPSSILPTPNPAAATPTLARSQVQTPLESPSLATYRAPEELGGDSSVFSGYFDQEAEKEEDLEGEHDVYFKVPEGDAGPSHINADAGPALQPEIPNGHELFTDEDYIFDGDEDDISMVVDEDDDEDDEYDDDDEEEEGDFPGGADAFPLDADADWEDDDDEGVEEGEIQIAGQQLNQGDAAQAQAPENDEFDGGADDDMEGAMEAIGMRGPIYGIVQNAALMVFVLDTAIGLGIWLPFTIGKSAALLSLNPRRLLQILHLPIRLMRLITDPIVDSIAFLVKRYALPPFVRVGTLMVNINVAVVLFVVSKIAGQAGADKLSDQLAHTYDQIVEIMDHPIDMAVNWVSVSDAPVQAAASGHFGIGKVFDSDFTLARASEPYFAALGQEVRVTLTRVKATWIRLALGHGTVDKIFAILLGYAVVGLMLALYLNILTVGNVRSAGRAVRSAVRQQLLVFKVAAFIIIELVVFPLGCGLMLDICSVWVFPEANLQSRTTFFVQAPLTATFYHWVAGTLFMYQFAIVLAGCRSIMRPGAMWFIKDPSDQNFHPIRDILDRPTLTQLRKLLASAVMYSIVVAIGVGSIAGLLILGFQSVLPLRWKTREPLSDVPIDLLFLHFALPYTMHYLRPKKVANQIVEVAWKKLAHQLRLTSYMFGDRYPLEEFTPPNSSWSTWFTGGAHVQDIRNLQDGSFRRVPANDNLALPRNVRAVAEVDALGQPLNEKSARLIQIQNTEAQRAKRNIMDDYTVVYMPPNFRYRIILFISALWTALAIFLASSFSLPILLGRRFFTLFTSLQVHDGYSFICGFYLIWACYIVGKAVDRMDKRRQRRGHDGPRAEFAVFLLKRCMLWLAKTSYMVVFLGIVIPILLSLVIDFYVVLPIRLTVNPDLKPRIRMVDAWALGLMYAKIAVQGHRGLHHPTRLMRGLTAIANNGWTHPDPVAATKEVIAPVSGGLAVLLLFPALLVWAMRSVFHLPIDGKFIFINIYPGLFAVVGFGRTLVVLVGLLSTWSQSVRDKEFLVEMRLRNLERDDPSSAQKEAKKEGVAVS